MRRHVARTPHVLRPPTGLSRAPEVLGGTPPAGSVAVRL
ncbi:hypothetical protein [Alloactinosynnema sp. L-07]|nr:hypothetical protein [Alloactinosynnema sp. L-07]